MEVAAAAAVDRVQPDSAGRMSRGLGRAPGLPVAHVIQGTPSLWGKWECPVALHRGALHFASGAARRAAEFTRVATPGGQPFGPDCPPRCSPSPVKTRALDPMLVEASLCTPQKAISACEVQAEKTPLIAGLGLARRL